MQMKNGLSTSKLAEFSLACVITWRNLTLRLVCNLTPIRNFESTLCDQLREQRKQIRIEAYYKMWK